MRFKSWIFFIWKRTCILFIFLPKREESQRNHRARNIRNIIPKNNQYNIIFRNFILQFSSPYMNIFFSYKNYVTCNIINISAIEIDKYNNVYRNFILNYFSWNLTFFPHMNFVRELTKVNWVEDSWVIRIRLSKKCLEGSFLSICVSNLQKRKQRRQFWLNIFIALFRFSRFLCVHLKSAIVNHHDIRFPFSIIQMHFHIPELFRASNVIMHKTVSTASSFQFSYKM